MVLEMKLSRIIYYTEFLKSNIYDYNDACTLIRDDITIADRDLATEVVFKICASVTKCITNIDEKTINEAEN